MTTATAESKAPDACASVASDIEGRDKLKVEASQRVTDLVSRFSAEFVCRLAERLEEELHEQQDGQPPGDDEQQPQQEARKPGALRWYAHGVNNLAEHAENIADALNSVVSLMRPYTGATTAGEMKPLLPEGHTTAVEWTIIAIVAELGELQKRIKEEAQIIRDACEIGGMIDGQAHAQDAERVVDKLSMQHGSEVAAVRRLVEFYIGHERPERRRIDDVIANWKPAAA